MDFGHLTLAVLCGPSQKSPGLENILDSFPNLKLLDRSSDPQSFIDQHQTAPPDVVLADLGEELEVPPWLGHIIQALPQSQVIVCSHNREPTFLIRVMQTGIKGFLSWPLSKTDLEAALHRVWIDKQQRLQQVEGSQGRILVVTGFKGGAGSTSIAINLAEALADLVGERVALVDLGRPFPDIGNFLDQEPHFSISDLLTNLSNLDREFLQGIMQPFGSNISILHGFKGFEDQEHFELAALDSTLAVLRDMYPYIVIDLGHWLDEFFIHTLTEADMVLILTGVTIPEIRNLKKLWPLLPGFHLDQNRLKIVVNLYNSRQLEEVRDLERIIQHPIFHTLPNDSLPLQKAIHEGNTLGIVAPRSKLRGAIKKLGTMIVKETGDKIGETATPAAPKKRFGLF